MADKSGIAWTDATWNPIIGCSKVSPGCLNCYAERMAARLAKMEIAKMVKDGLDAVEMLKKKGYASVINQYGEWIGNCCHAGDSAIVLKESALEIPLHWRNPRRIFVNSMSDTFHEKVPFEFIDRMFAVMALCPQHTFQVLTKRPEQMLRYRTDQLRKTMWHSVVCRTVELFEKRMPALEKIVKGVLPNVHLGTTCENQDTVNPRTPHLLQTPAAVRFVSAEPLLGDIDFFEFTEKTWICNGCGESYSHDDDVTCNHCGYAERHLEYRSKLDQVIIGAESIGGHPGRECKIEWVRNIVRQCKAAGVAVFVKQIHMWKIGETGVFETEQEALDKWSSSHLKALRLKPKRVLLKYPRDKELFPVDLRVWEYPTSK